MIYIPTSTSTILKVHSRPQEPRDSDPVACAELDLRLKKNISADSFSEQTDYLSNAAKASFVALNPIDQKNRFGARVSLNPINSDHFNFSQGSSSSGLGYALGIFESWWALALEKPSKFESPIFATGEIGRSGAISAISHINEKLESVCDLAEQYREDFNKFVFCYPKDNQSHIDVNLILRAEKLGAKLLPSDRLQALLLDLLGNNYDGEPAGRWEPFLGLRSFSYSDSMRFFGRDRETNELYDAIFLQDKPVVLSGTKLAGKTSLIQAGLLPKIDLLRADCHYSFFTPREIINSSDSLLDHFLHLIYKKHHEIMPHGLADQLRNSFLRNMTPVDNLFRNKKEIVIIGIDQFEELFQITNIDNKNIGAALSNLFSNILTLGVDNSSKKDNDQFFITLTEDIRIISTLATRISQLKLIVSTTSEYHTAIAINNLLPNAKVVTLCEMIPISNLTEIIEDQAAFSNISFEIKNEIKLSDSLIQDASRTSIPLAKVQLTLDLLYKENENLNFLTFSGYESLRGIEGGYARFPQRILEECKPSTNETAIFWGLFFGIDSHGKSYSKKVNSKILYSFYPNIIPMVAKYQESGLIDISHTDEKGMHLKFSDENIHYSWSELSDWLTTNSEYLRLMDMRINDKFLSWQWASLDNENLKLNRPNNMGTPTKISISSSIYKGSKNVLDRFSIFLSTISLINFSFSAFIKHHETNATTDDKWLNLYLFKIFSTPIKILFHSSFMYLYKAYEYHC